MTTTETVPALKVPDPGVDSVNELPQPTPLESQNCGYCPIDTNVPLGIVPDTSCRLMLIDVAPAAAMADAVKV